MKTQFCNIRKKLELFYIRRIEVIKPKKYQTKL